MSAGMGPERLLLERSSGHATAILKSIRELALKTHAAEMKSKNLVFVGMPAFYNIKSTYRSLCIVMERPVQLIALIN
jgi:hypothetical protein